MMRMITAILLAFSLSAAADPLSSWNDGAAKQAITSFVTHVTTPGSADYVPPSERIAVFDSDGTLSVEQPSRVERMGGRLDEDRLVAGRPVAAELPMKE
jgi:hypothetical protein